MSNMEEVGDSLSAVMLSAWKAEGGAWRIETTGQRDRELHATIATSLGNIMAAASELRERFGGLADGLVEPRNDMHNATLGLKRVSIASDVESEAIANFRAAEGQTSSDDEGLLGVQTSLRAIHLAYKLIESRLGPVVEAANEAASRANALPELLEGVRQNSTHGCEVITNYARNAGIPVANPYE